MAWGLFVAAAAVPAIAILAVALRAASAESLRVRKDEIEERVAIAHELSRRIEVWVGEMRAHLAAVPAEVTTDALAASLQRSERPYADSFVQNDKNEVVVPAALSKNALPSPECTAARSALDTNVPRAEARDRIIAVCPDLRSEAGRFLWPLLAYETPAVTAERWRDWLSTYGDQLGESERALLRVRLRERIPDALTSSIEAILQRPASLRTTIDALLAEPPVEDVSDSGVRMRRGRSIVIVRTFPSGVRGGVAVHEGSMLRASAEWAGSEWAGFALASGAGKDGAEFKLAPNTTLQIVRRDPGAIDARARSAAARIVAISVGCVLLSVGLAALLFTRARRAQRLAELRTDFVAAVSHELRTPLASVRMFTELLEAGQIPPEERAEVQRTLAAETRRLSTTLDRMLRFGALSRGKLAVEKQRVRLADVAQAAADRFRSAHPDRTVLVDADDAASADADAHLLGLVLDNLLSNAAKYAPHGAPYRLRAFCERNEAVLSVADSGPGLDPRAQTRVFLPFERADDRLSKATEGTGVGLALVRGIARAHGGDASVESASGKGATFSVRFPREALAGQEGGAGWNGC
jgi:two-component system phosphate regulon sensor histidine kinase PhoR